MALLNFLSFWLHNQNEKITVLILMFILMSCLTLPKLFYFRRRTIRKMSRQSQKKKTRRKIKKTRPRRPSQSANSSPTAPRCPQPAKMPLRWSVNFPGKMKSFGTGRKSRRGFRRLTLIPSPAGSQRLPIDQYWLIVRLMVSWPPFPCFTLHEETFYTGRLLSMRP